MSGSKQQTTTASSEPWKPAQAALQSGLSDAQSLYKAGIGSKPYTGSTVVPYAKQSIQGMNQQQAAANAALPAFNSNFNQVKANASNGGLNALQLGSVNRLQGMADGSYLNNNPYLEDMIERNSRDIAGASNLSASAAGRYGSGSHQNVTEKNVGDAASSARLQNYNTERGYMQDAIGSLFNAGQQQQNNINSNTDALLGAYQGTLAPSQTLQGIGANYEDLAGRTLNDQLRIFSEQQNAPWNQISRLNGIASGAGSLGGTQQNTAQGPSRISSALGGAIGGGSLLGPLGAIGGGLLGAFG